ENIGLLQDLGIRYVLVHQYGYKREDWPTVLAQLRGADDRLEQAAEFGELTIYRLQPASEPPPAVSIELFAPSLAVHNIYWEPIFIVRNPSNRLAILGAADFRPSRLTVRWRDERGREVRRESKEINLPAVVPAGETALHLQPDQPAAPGHYTVDLDVTGGLDIHRTVEVDVAERLPAASEEGPPLAFAGASMATDTLRPGDTANLTLDWETRRQPDEDLTIFAQLIGPDGKVWGQYDAPAGW